MNDSRATPAPSNWNLPNVLTVVRILLVPVFLVLLLGHGGEDPAWRVWAFVVFVVAMLTDWVDGTLARRWRMITDFGKIADPIADKALMAAALIGLWLVGTLPLWVPIVILVRELGITILRFAIIRRVVLPASKGGKLKTVLQTGAIALMLLWVPALVWFPALFTAWTVVAWVVMT
ncbi:MAG TPA: CDP-diacylglycerol--glycerol-3-phosphate 3-phosphatidyltransferase, partial [Brevibacterium sp.]|nr:CDP-diacylglycerol--glycerol-3-phosphate 3-phosphatidyltransferase [Brevibacterium sp.]